jgi:hypothetical protein
MKRLLRLLWSSAEMYQLLVWADHNIDGLHMELYGTPPNHHRYEQLRALIDYIDAR